MICLITMYAQRTTHEYIVNCNLGIFFCRVFRRFLEIQDISNKNDEMTYEELKTIVASYSDLCKCPELKVTFFSKTLFLFIIFVFSYLGKSISQTDLQGFL